jgi:hypothetical protein
MTTTSAHIPSFSCFADYFLFGFILICCYTRGISQVQRKYLWVCLSIIAIWRCRKWTSPSEKFVIKFGIASIQSDSLAQSDEPGKKRII